MEKQSILSLGQEIYKISQKHPGSSCKDSRNNLKRLSVAKDETIFVPVKRMLLMDLNLSNIFKSMHSHIYVYIHSNNSCLFVCLYVCMFVL